MSYTAGDSVELTKDAGGGAKKGDCGDVKIVNSNGKLTIKITHKGPDCTPVDFGQSVIVSEDNVTKCDC